ncbi:MAG: HEAT repeat domain-containing protein, partial [Gemmataceae bacterium]
MQTVTILLVMILILVPALLLLARRQRRLAARDELSPISRQHIELFQGGQLNEAAVETTKARFRDLLERGEVAAVEASMRAGMQFVVQVRALAELGTEDAGRILERQLGRRLTDDQIEQSWYWIDLANGLRSLNRAQSLPHLLRTAEQAGEVPLSQFFAAETVCFLGFGGYVRQAGTTLGRAALKVLLRAMQGLRSGVPAVVVSEARIGELVETLWDTRPDTVDPLAVRIFQESLRLLRRADHLGESHGGEAAERETFDWQMSRLGAIEPSLEDYLSDSPPALCRSLGRASLAEQREILLALADLRAEAADAVLPLLSINRYPHADAALEVLTWSRDPRIGPALRELVLAKVPMVRRAQSRPRAHPPRRPSVGAEVPYRAVLRALRNHGSPPTEAMLLLAARDWDPTYRLAAVGSLGWWEPMQRGDVLVTLQEASQRDANPEVRLAARAALGRLGERQALTWYRHRLTNENAQVVYEAIQAIANEGLTLLWPDLDKLADAEDSDVAHHAKEALERMGE